MQPLCLKLLGFPARVEYFCLPLQIPKGNMFIHSQVCLSCPYFPCFRHLSEFS